MEPIDDLSGLDYTLLVFLCFIKNPETKESAESVNQPA